MSEQQRQKHESSRNPEYVKQEQETFLAKAKQWFQVTLPPCFEEDCEMPNGTHAHIPGAYILWDPLEEDADKFGLVAGFDIEKNDPLDQQTLTLQRICLLAMVKGLIFKPATGHKLTTDKLKFRKKDVNWSNEFGADAVFIEHWNDLMNDLKSEKPRYMENVRGLKLWVDLSHLLDAGPYGTSEYVSMGFDDWSSQYAKVKNPRIFQKLIFQGV